MSHADHEWAKEHLPAHLAGGLSAEERARLEAHLSGCAECIAEIDALRRFDRGMEELFGPVRPKPGLEERVIRGLRAVPSRGLPSVAARVGLAAAAVLLLGIVGVVILSVEGSAMPRVTAALHEPPAPMTPESVAFDDSGSAKRPMNADEMARDAARRQLAKLQDVDRGFFDASDHNETAAEEDALKAKGDSLYALTERSHDARKELKSRAAKPPAVPGVHAARDANAGRFEPATEKLYSYRNDAPSGKDGKPAAPQVGYFKPGEMAAADRLVQRAEKKEGDKRQAAADPGKPQADEKAEKQQQAPAEEQTQRKIIRTGEMEFEIENFDAAVANVTKIAGEEQGFIGTVNSEKLPNGKVRGTVVVRCPPENLDRLLLKLRALGELKSQRIASQDVTKMYTDLEGRLRAARTMEERLIQIIKEGKGQIKDLLAAEKELGEWRTKIEVFEGEIRYYNGMISLSTLTITLYEKEIRSPFGVIETERVQMGIEAEDVEKAHKDALAAVADAKGRVTRSELKQHGPGQLSAIVNCEVPPDAAGPLRDRLKQLGTVARLDVQRDQQTEGGSGKPAELKVKKNDAVFSVSLYNLTNVAPRETVHLNLASADAEKSYKDILARIEKAGGRVITSTLQQPKKDQTTGTVRFEVKSADAEAVLNDLKTYGEVMRLQRTENPDAQNVTRSKQGFECQVYALGMVAPRETTTIQLACKDVPAAYQEILAAVRKAEGRILSAGLNEQDRHNVTGTIDFEVRRELKKAVDDAMAASGPVFSRNASQAQDLENVVDSKTRLQLTLLNIERIPPRETHTLALEVGNVERRVGEIVQLAADVKGRVTGPFLSKDSSGRMVGRITLDVPLAAALPAVQKVKDLASEVRMIESSRNPSVPESDLSVARIDVTLSNEVILPTDSSPWANIRKGLSVSLTALSWSLTLIVIGLCFALPLGLAGWGGWKVYQKVRAKAA
jgi:glycine cleavage system regulatory protein